MPHTSIGIIGLGFLGTAIAQRLVHTSFPVLGYDVSAEKVLDAVGKGVKASSLGEMARQCRAIVLAVFNAEQAASVIREYADQVADAPGDRPLLICCTTCPPASMRQLAALAANRGLRFLEYPISGTAVNVARGEGLGLAGGDKSIVNQHEDILAGICPDWLYLGTLGSATAAKLSINLVLQINRSAIAEGLVFAESLGLELGPTLNAFQRSAAQSLVMATKGPKMVNQDFAPQSNLSLTLKDISIMEELAISGGLWLPLFNANADLFRSTAANLGDDVDPAACIEGLRMGAKERHDQVDAKTKLIDLDRDRCSALVQHDVDTLARIYHEDLVYAHSSGLVEGKNDLLGSIANGSLRYHEVRTENVDVKLSGSTAILHGRIFMEVTMRGASRSMRNSFLSTWAKQSDTWKLLSYSATPLPA